MKKVPWIFAIVLLLMTGCARNVITVYDLRCENLTEPTGIATLQPGLSWKVGSGKNGSIQEAYQILAASKPELLEDGRADLWNSGKTESPASVLVPYDGKDLKSGSVCYWKVRVWDETGNISGWSATSGFTVGLLDETDWKAVYIGLAGKENGVVSPQFWKTFNIRDKSERIFVHVNSLGYHEIYVNGAKVGNKVLTPDVSQFSKRSLIITYDITPYVRQGRNDVVFWLGSGWYSKGLPGVEYDRPMVRAQAEQINDGIPEIIFKTDSTWKARISGYSRIGTWRSHDYGGEKIDASLLLPDLTSSSLEGSEWLPVFQGENYGIPSTPQLSESNTIADSVRADTVMVFKDGKWLVDMGKTLSGWVQIIFPTLSPGQEIDMEYSDHLEKDGNLKDQGQYDRYVAAGKGPEKFKSKFNYHGFRYITISNLDRAPLKQDITAYLIHTDYRLASSFECSDKDLNNIHNMIFYTLQCLSTGGDLVDCPQIERLGYGGDGNASTLTAQTMFDLEPLYSNWLQAWSDCVREDGGMPHTAPNPYPAGGGPYWCGFIITASWKTYVNYGDIRILEKYYPVMQKWLGYVEKYSPEGLLEPWPDTDYRAWYLGDWAVPEGTDQTDKSSVSVVNNCFISVCYETMEKIAVLLGRDSDAVNYARRRENIGQIINHELYDPLKHIYGSGSQIDLAFPMIAGVVPDSLTGRILKNFTEETVISHKGHFACGLVGIPVVTEWAVRNHQTDLMYSMLKKRDYPGYLYMIDNGATTTWEHWNGARSRIHNCYNGIGSWFYQAVGGIIPDEKFPGYRHFYIDPQIPQGVYWAKTAKETPYGKIYVSWKACNGIFDMEVQIPFGTRATIIFPPDPGKVTINGRQTDIRDHRAEVGSGIYKVKCQIKS